MYIIKIKLQTVTNNTKEDKINFNHSNAQSKKNSIHTYRFFLLNT